MTRGVEELAVETDRQRRQRKPRVGAAAPPRSPRPRADAERRRAARRRFRAASHEAPVAPPPSPVAPPPDPTPAGLGWLPVLCLVAAGGLLMMSVAFAATRADAPWGAPLFWASLLLIYLPVLVRLLASSASRGERIGLVLMLGVALYLVKVLRDPTGYSFHDELLHWRTADDILTSGHLFAESPMLIVSSLYPALEVVTAAVAQLTGLDNFTSGLLVIGAARIVFVLALFFLFEGAVGSAQVAALGVALYMTNPKFLFFNALFAYESLALALLVLVLFVVERRSRARGKSAVSLTLIALMAIAALVTTHHVTSLVVVLTLFLWSVFHRLTRRGQTGEPDPWGLAIVAAGAAAVWLVFVATIAVEYLGGPVLSAVQRLVDVIAGEEQARQLFTASTGQAAPVWERLAGMASAGMIVLGLPFGLLALWRQHRKASAPLLLAAIALAYPATLPMRFTGGADISGRAWSFLFLGVAPVLALAAWSLRSRLRRDLLWRPAVAAPAAILLVGGLCVGIPHWGRLPGPYLAGADIRSINLESIASAEWVRAELGPDNRVAGDATNRLLMGSYGRQDVVWGRPGEQQLWRVFLSPKFGAAEARLLELHDVEYVVMDRRLADTLPISGEYYEKGENLRIRDGKPLDAATLAKFDSVPGVSRIFDSGHVQLYDVQRFSDGR